MRYVLYVDGVAIKDDIQCDYLLASVFGDNANVLQVEDIGDRALKIYVECDQKASDKMVLGLGSDVSFSYRELV